ncbi:MAG TPA: patatin-like phospholipase family protein [Nitrososphaeraceae archaeon]|jgi:NTE family protein|nr:patatin-like phospholipase family protein [Nitrososphaeraceae archaeon]
MKDKKELSSSAGIENVLVLQGGGSLGAYECGVYKTLDRYGIKLDVVAGTSIGAVNAAIIVGAKNDNPAQLLEDFWMAISENITSFIPNNIRPSLSVLYGSMYGNRNVFEPKWLFPYESLYHYQTSPSLYDVLPLRKTLCRYVDFAKINDSRDKSTVPRLIITATNIQNSEPVTFDSMNVNIDLDHIISCIGYPFYGISWIQKDGKYLWDGSLQSNTPLREVIDASPRKDKNVYIVNLFPRKHHELPSNMFETWHRARDIIYTDRTSHNVRMSEVFSRYIRLIEGMHEIITSSTDERAKSRFRESSEREYRKLVQKRGAIIRNIVRIERSEDTHFLFEDADFSLHSIKHLIKRGEEDAEQALNH